jgi:hypothetical protein
MTLLVRERGQLLQMWSGLRIKSQLHSYGKPMEDAQEKTARAAVSALQQQLDDIASSHGFPVSRRVADAGRSVQTDSLLKTQWRQASCFVEMGKISTKVKTRASSRLKTVANFFPPCSSQDSLGVLGSAKYAPSVQVPSSTRNIESRSGSREIAPMLLQLPPPHRHLLDTARRRADLMPVERRGRSSAHPP